MLNEYVSNWMKKVSKDLGYDSCSVLIQFLKEDIKEEPNKINMLDNNVEENEENMEETNEDNEIQMVEDD